MEKEKRGRKNRTIQNKGKVQIKKGMETNKE